MHIEFSPVICWLTQESEQTYEESRDEILITYIPIAARYQKRHHPVSRSGYPAKALVMGTLDSLQRIILGQYLPHLNGRAAVTRIWEHWEGTGIQVLLEDRRVDVLEFPFPADEEVCEKPFADGRAYKFKFYNTETPRQRRRWFLHLLEQAVIRIQRKEEPHKETQVEDDALPLAAVAPSFAKHTEVSDFARKIASIADPADIRLVLRERKNESQEERQQKTRAKKNLFAAGQIILRVPNERVAGLFYSRLLETPDPKRRKKILIRFFQLYCTELWKERKEPADETHTSGLRGGARR
jgi:hypothetical protein